MIKKFQLPDLAKFYQIRDGYYSF